MSDQTQKRTENTAKLLKYLHFNGPQRRSHLAQELDMRPNSVGSITQDLLENNWIELTEPSQPRSTLQLSSHGAWALAISTDGDEVKLAKVNLMGDLEFIETLCESSIDPEKFIEIVNQAISKNIKGTPKGSCLGLGISLSGIVNSSKGEVIRSINFGPWENVQLCRNLEEKLSIPVIVENDMRCMAWAHAWFDQLSTQYQNVLFLGLGRGVSCSTLVGDQLYRGAHHLAGEIGHLKSGSEQRLCVCGKYDCLETYISMDAILKTANQIFTTSPTLNSEKDLVPFIGRDPRMNNLLNRISEHLAPILGPILIASDPDALIISSEEQTFSNALIPYLSQNLQSYLLGIGLEKPQLIAFGERQKNELRGAAAFIIQHAFESGVSPS